MTPSERETACRWIRANRIPIPDDWTSTQQLQNAVTKLLADRRVLFLGEADHFIHEKADYRGLFAELVHSLRFDTFVEEFGRHDGKLVNSYLKTGDTKDLERVTIYGYRGHQRLDRDDQPTGILKGTADGYPTEEFASEHKRLMERLRALSGPVAFHGFDVDASPGGAYADLSVEKPALDRVEGETLPQEIERLRSFVDANEGSTDVQSLADALAYIQWVNPAETYEAMNPAMAFRENVMYRHAEEAIASAQGHTTFWAHNIHLARDDEKLTSHYGAVGPGGDSLFSVGHYLHGRYPGDIASIWMVTGGGEDLQPLPGLPQKLDYPENSWNGLFREVGGNFLLPLTDDFPARGSRLPFYHLYNTFVECALTDQCDAICFINEVTPLQVA
ncbi:MAG: erythromycin esterase family protein [Pseudomonadota bacterium]